MSDMISSGIPVERTKIPARVHLMETKGGGSRRKNPTASRKARRRPKPPVQRNPDMMRPANRAEGSGMVASR